VNQRPGGDDQVDPFGNDQFADEDHSRTLGLPEVIQRSYRFTGIAAKCSQGRFLLDLVPQFNYPCSVLGRIERRERAVLARFLKGSGRRVVGEFRAGTEFGLLSE